MNKVQTLLALPVVVCHLSAQNSIRIDTKTTLGTASPYIFGQFIEYMGRDIEGGIYNPKPRRLPSMARGKMRSKGQGGLFGMLVFSCSFIASLRRRRKPLAPCP